MIRTEKLVINDETFVIKPLKGDSFADFFSILSKLSDKGDEDIKLSDLTRDESKSLYNLCLSSAKDARPDLAKDMDTLERFVTQNLFQFVPIILKVNLPEKE